MFHSIEFMRQLAIMATALVNTNLLMVYYGLSLNVVFGVVAYIIALAARFSADGMACADKQEGRSTYLSLQFIPLILLFFSAFHIMLIMRLRGEEWCHEVSNEEDEEDD